MNTYDSCYNESEKELFYMKWLIVERLISAKLMALKCLNLVLVYRYFYKNKPQTARNKGFRTYVNSKAITLKP